MILYDILGLIEWSLCQLNMTHFNQERLVTVKLDIDNEVIFKYLFLIICISLRLNVS